MAYDTNPNAPPPSRPLGVAILSVLVGLFGFLWIVAGILLLAGVVLTSYFDSSALPAAFGLTGVVAGGVILIVGLIILGIALGLWHLRLWALVLALIVVFVELATFAIARDFASWGFVISLLLFVYLLAVHRHFR